jgi:RNA-directed DNA polymerase
MSLVTPERIRTLQRKLYRKAKAEPAYRFYVLYDKIHREDILCHAYGLAREAAQAEADRWFKSAHARFKSPSGCRRG